MKSPQSYQTALKVLLVEDNPVNQRLTKRLVEQLGQQVDIAGNGEEGVKASQRQFYHLILMDVMMPKMDGIEASTHILAQYREAPVQPVIVAVTAFTTKEVRERCETAGIHDFSPKPISRNQLVKLFEKWFPA